MGGAGVNAAACRIPRLTGLRAGVRTTFGASQLIGYRLSEGGGGDCSAQGGCRAALSGAIASQGPARLSQHITCVAPPTPRRSGRGALLRFLRPLVQLTYMRNVHTLLFWGPRASTRSSMICLCSWSSSGRCTHATDPYALQMLTE